MPAESAAKAKEILQQAIQALGGTAYLNLHDATCEGRLSQFGHAGELNGFEKFVDYTIPPFKDRTENLPKRNIITVMNGDKGWTLDRGGVSDASGADVAHFEEDTKKDLDYILRTRIKEPNMVFRYAGPDIVDLKEVGLGGNRRQRQSDDQNRDFAVHPPSGSKNRGYARCKHPHENR